MAEKLADLFIKNENISEDDKEVICYGLDCFLSKIINTTLPFPIVLCMGVGKEYLLFLLLFGILRSKVGGYHADTRVRCSICSCLLLLSAMFWTSLLSTYEPGEIQWMLIAFTVFLEGIIYILAPVDTENKRLVEGEKRYYRKICALWLGFMDVIMIISMCMGYMIYVNVMQAVLISLLVLLIGGIVKNICLVKEKTVLFKQ